MTDTLIRTGYEFVPAAGLPDASEYMPAGEAPEKDIKDVSELYITVELDDERELRTWIIPVSETPTAYMDALRYGQAHDSTVIWGEVREPETVNGGLKMAVIFDHGDITDPGDVSQALKEVAGSVGSDRKFYIKEYYGETTWRSVVLPPK